MRFAQYFLSMFFLIAAAFGCNPDTEPTPHSYSSIKESKENKVFVNAYLPLSSGLTIEGIDFTIKEAWAEHPHRWAGQDFIISKSTFDFVITLESSVKSDIDFSNYTKNLTGGNSKIWFFLKEKEFKQDTLIIKYKDHAGAQRQKQLLLIKQESN